MFTLFLSWNKKNILVISICTIINIQITRKDSIETTSNWFLSVLRVHKGNWFFNNVFFRWNILPLIALILIIILWVVLSKTRFRLRLRECGENVIANNVGINVDKIRYIWTAIGSGSDALSHFVIFSCMPLGVWQIMS